MLMGKFGEGLAFAIEQFCHEARQSLDEIPMLEGSIERLLLSSQEIEIGLKGVYSAEREQSLQEEQEKLEKRLGALKKLMRYAKVDNAEDLVDFAERMRAELEWLRDSRETLARLQERSASLKKEVSILALSQESRKEAAKKLEICGKHLPSGPCWKAFGWRSLKPLEKVRQEPTA